ncbi:MAG: NAD(P)-binding domain-containing protein [Gemmatimonadota bacterium]
MHVTLLGAGSVGSAMGRRLAAVGVPVRYGLRDIPSPADLPGPASDPRSAAAGADLVLVAVPADAAVEALSAAAPAAGTVVVDLTNPLRWDQGPVWAPPAGGSVAARLAEAFPHLRVLKGFNHFGAEIQADPAFEPARPLALFAGDDAEAKQVALGLAERMGFEALDAGPLRNAALLEALAVTWIHLATVGGAGREIAFQLLRR